MSQKSMFYSFLLLSIVALSACGNKNQETTQSSSSASTTVQQSSTRSSSSSSEETISETSSEAEIEVKSNFDIDVSKLGNYQTPTDVEKYAGTYTLTDEIKSKFESSLESDEAKDGRIVELKINEDGTYRKLEKIYSYKENVTVLHSDFDSKHRYGYFDENNQFQIKEFPMIDILEKSYYDVPEIKYSQGVLVAKYGDIYLVDVITHAPYSDGYYLTSTGEKDELATLLKHGAASSYFINGEVSLSSYEMPYREVGVGNDNLDKYFSIKDDKLVYGDKEFQETEQVSELVEKTLSELLSEELVTEKFANLNGFYQYKTGAHLPLTISYNLETKQPQEIDFSKVYLSSGSRVKNGLGYKIGTEGYLYAYKKTYLATENDGKFILK